LAALFSGGLSKSISGGLFVNQLSFWAVVEGTPEEVVSFIHHLNANAAPGSRITQGSFRVATHVEDVPSRAFSGFIFRKLNLPADPLGVAALASEFEDSHPCSFVNPIYHGIVEMGYALIKSSPDGSRALLGNIEESFGANLPSDEKVQALAGATKVGTLFSTFFFSQVPHKSLSLPHSPHTPSLMQLPTIGSWLAIFN